MPNHAYFERNGEGDWYACLDAASPGETPFTHPAKWAKIGIPTYFERPIVELAVGYLLQSDGQTDKRREQNKEGEAELYRAYLQFRNRGDYRPMPVHAARE